MICLLALDIKNYTKRITKIISGKATLNQFYFDYKNYIYCSMRKDLEIFLIYLTTYFWPLFPLNFPKCFRRRMKGNIGLKLINSFRATGLFLYP